MLKIMIYHLAKELVYMPKPSAAHPNGTVFRVNKNRIFTCMATNHLRDSFLSLKSKGLLSLMLSLPDDWNYTLTGLATLSKDSIDSVRSAIRELEARYYISRRRLRTPDGRIGGFEYLVYENPADNPDYQPDREVERSPPLDFPTLDNPTLEKPILENPTQLNMNRTKYEKNQISSHSLRSEPAGTEPEGVRDAAEPLPQGYNAILRAVGYTGMLENTDEETRGMLCCCGPDTDALCACRIPYAFSQDAKLMKQTLSLLAGLDYCLRDSTPENVQHFDAVLESLAAMATTPKAVYHGQIVRYHQVIDKINAHIAEYDGLYGFLCGFDEEWQRILREHGDEIRHIAKYMRACLWQWLCDSSIISDGIDRMFR